MGSTGSRLLTGNSLLAENAEITAARIHRSDTATLFNSGFNALQGLLGCVASPQDAILSDQLVHASIHEGIRTSRAALKDSFLHNDLEDLREKLHEALEAVPGSVGIAREKEHMHIFLLFFHRACPSR